jgi:dihydrofolate reductase
MKIILIAAKAKNDIIGTNGSLPWHLPSDLQHFKNTTMGAPMIMGSRTWESFGCRALPGRHHIVITSKSILQIRDKDTDRVHQVTSLEAALKLGGFLAQSVDKNLFVIGGANVYAQVFSLVDELIISEIDREYPGDCYFPAIDPMIWSSIRVPEAPEIPYRIITYAR